MNKKFCFRCARVLLSFLLISLIDIGSSSPVFAWKVKTHVYSANLIMDEIRQNKKGMFTALNYGSWQSHPIGQVPGTATWVN